MKRWSKVLGALRGRADVGHRPDLEQVRESIRSEGSWVEVEEWRIGTETTSRIAPVDRPWPDPAGAGPPRYFKVTVECEGRFECWAPTLERAIEFVGIYRALTIDLYYEYGWSSWARKDRLEPIAGETTA